jgi:hypothetical protein
MRVVMQRVCQRASTKCASQGIMLGTKQLCVLPFAKCEEQHFATEGVLRSSPWELGPIKQAYRREARAKCTPYDFQTAQQTLPVQSQET